jgi:hypothetical protein
MSKSTNYHAVWGPGPFGMDDAVSIRSPRGKELAFIWFSHEPDAEEAAGAMANATLIADALNAYKSKRGRKPAASRARTYYATLDRNGTEDEITIISPSGESLAYIWFWDEPDTRDARKAEADARLIMDALNAYRPRRGGKKLPDGGRP